MKNRRNKKCLINPTRQEELENEPLLAFSFYLSDKNNLLLDLSDKIIENLDKGFQSVSTELIAKASIMTWFWTLGAYEVIRTICQAKDCFSNTTFIEKICNLKQQLAIVRMPSAKMEKRGNKKKPVNSNRSPDGWDLDNKDLLIGDPENPRSARLLIKQYDETLCSLKPKDVIKRHEESTNYKTKTL